MLDEAIEKHPDWAELYAQRSRTNLGLGNIQEAFHDARKVIELLPNAAEVYLKIKKEQQR
jgi:tetratricopeptide (TPR) repeat protein